MTTIAPGTIRSYLSSMGLFVEFLIEIGLAKHVVGFQRLSLKIIAKKLKRRAKMRRTVVETEEIVLTKQTTDKPKAAKQLFKKIVSQGCIDKKAALITTGNDPTTMEQALQHAKSSNKQLWVAPKSSSDANEEGCIIKFFEISLNGEHGVTSIVGRDSKDLYESGSIGAPQETPDTINREHTFGNKAAREEETSGTSYNSDQSSNYPVSSDEGTGC
ncbi:unnamed protein product [Mytilus edulis]|uniref:Uncharacterized protein n=1 Tax=Mytilus edulis TaxID=6550 RepID=A0A8S3U028_MYTED|nr:unnamed protein product [Mytilus edulis]